MIDAAIADTAKRFATNVTPFDESLLGLFNGDAEKQFYFWVVTNLFSVSFDRRMNEGPKGLLESACRKSVLDRIKDHKKPFYLFGEQYVSEVVAGLMANTMLRHITQVRLRRERNDMFPEDFYMTMDEPIAQGTEHPMRSFARFLDEYDHLQGIDPAFGQRHFRAKRTVVSLRRVGLAVLPPEEWEGHVKRREPPEGYVIGEPPLVSRNAGASIQDFLV